MVCQAATFEERDVSKWAQTYLKDAALMVGSFARLAQFDTRKASSYTRVIGPLGLSTRNQDEISVPQGYAVILLLDTQSGVSGMFMAQVTSPDGKITISKCDEPNGEALVVFARGTKRVCRMPYAD